tara:strand:+ start:235 stop:528 length:294 start_codon:yes stop_codon:yes gene_type:complete
MMETYADLLRREKMTNYDIDEREREERRKSVVLGENKKEQEKVEIELEDNLVIKLALDAHERDVTLNQHMIDIIKKHLKDSEYKFENGTKPQVLKEY